MGEKCVDKELVMKGVRANKMREGDKKTNIKIHEGKTLERGSMVLHIYVCVCIRATA